MFTTHPVRSGRAQRRHVTREEAAAAALGGPAPPGFDPGGEEATGRPPTEHTIRIEVDMESKNWLAPRGKTSSGRTTPAPKTSSRSSRTHGSLPPKALALALTEVQRVKLAFYSI